MKIKIIYDKEIEPRPIIKDVYKMPNIDQLIEQGFSLHMGRKYDEILHEFYEASGHYMYLPLGDKLRQWIKEGEGDQVKIFCTFLYKFFQNRKALLYEVEKFFNEDEIAELRRMVEVDRMLEKDRKRQIEKLRSVCPKCGNKHTARIVYGMPVMDEEMEKVEAEGRIWFGGCCLEDYRYYCSNCELKF